MIDGVDLSSYDVGDVLRLPETEARLLVAEGWADPVDSSNASASASASDPRPHDPGSPSREYSDGPEA
jgi:hypothetical protein